MSYSNYRKAKGGAKLSFKYETDSVQQLASAKISEISQEDSSSITESSCRAFSDEGLVTKPGEDYSYLIHHDSESFVEQIK